MGFRLGRGRYGNFFPNTIRGLALNYNLSRGSMDYRVFALLGQFWIIQFRSLIFLSSTILSAVCLAESDLEEDWESHGKP